jgi:hypothetical protein
MRWLPCLPFGDPFSPWLGLLTGLLPGHSSRNLNHSGIVLAAWVFTGEAATPVMLRLALGCLTENILAVRKQGD